jgi:tetratricopeptide (TPR) repeat protein
MPEPIVPADHWPTGPPGALAALKRGLAEDPAARPISATDLVAQVEAGLTADVTRPTQALDTLPELRRTAPAVAPAGHARQGGGRTQIVLAVVAVAAIALVVGAVALGGGSGSDPAKVAKTGPGKAHGSEKAGDASPSGGGESGSAPSPAPAAASSSTASQSAAPVASGDGAALNQQGFALINEGRPEEAVPILREAVGAYPAGSTDLGYAYALFNLGHALRLSGHPDEAIQILERRLEIPDQQGTVAAELARARAEAGE